MVRMYVRKRKQRGQGEDTFPVRPFREMLFLGTSDIRTKVSSIGKGWMEVAECRQRDIREAFAEERFCGRVSDEPTRSHVREVLLEILKHCKNLRANSSRSFFWKRNWVCVDAEGRDQCIGTVFTLLFDWIPDSILDLAVDMAHLLLKKSTILAVIKSWGPEKKN